MATDNEHNSSLHLFRIMNFHGITITEYAERLAVNKFYELVLVSSIYKFWEEVSKKGSGITCYILRCSGKKCASNALIE